MQKSTDELNHSWIRYKIYKDERARSQIIHHYAYLVKITVGRLVLNLSGSIEREDLIGAGIIGLIKSVDQFDPTRDVKFETYAIALIRGAVLEMLREEDWAPRSIREKLKALDRAQMTLESKLGHPPSVRELSEHLGFTDQDIFDLMVRMGRTNIYSLDDVYSNSDSDDSIHFIEMVVDEAINPSREVEGREIRRMLVHGIDRLPDRERLVVALYYFKGLTFKEIGKVLGVSESRVYQLHTQAVNRLKMHLNEQGALQVA